METVHFKFIDQYFPSTLVLGFDFKLEFISSLLGHQALSWTRSLPCYINSSCQHNTERDNRKTRCKVMVFIWLDRTMVSTAARTSASSGNRPGLVAGPLVSSRGGRSTACSWSAASSSRTCITPYGNVFGYICRMQYKMHINIIHDYCNSWDKYVLSFSRKIKCHTSRQKMD